MSTKYWVRALPILAVGLAGWVASAADAAGSGSKALKYEEPTLLTGTLYAKDSGRKQVLFKFKRTATRVGSKLNVLREYTYPDGKPAARERLTYDGNDLISYALEELQNGAAGSARIRREPGNPAKGTLLFEYNKEPRPAPRPSAVIPSPVTWSQLFWRIIGASWRAAKR
jgi:hypothetical protein